MSERIEKYKWYYQNWLEGKTPSWSIDRIDTLLDRGLITQEEYDYITGSEDGKPN